MKKLHSIFLEPSRTNGIQPLVNLSVALASKIRHLKAIKAKSLIYIYIYIYGLGLLRALAIFVGINQKPTNKPVIVCTTRIRSMALPWAFSLYDTLTTSKKPIVELLSKQLSMINDSVQLCFLQDTNRCEGTSPYYKLLYLSVY